MARRYFSINEAREELPIIQEILETLQEHVQKIKMLSSVHIDLNDVEADEYTTLNTQFAKDYHHVSYQLYTEVEKLLTIGCVLKDIEEGLIDFYAEHEGRDIFLCYKLGEDTITHWHELDTGYSARRPVEELDRYH